MSTDPQTLDPVALREVVQAKNGEAASSAQKGETASCCSSSCCGGTKDPITSDLDEAQEVDGK